MAATMRAEARWNRMNSGVFQRDAKEGDSFAFCSRRQGGSAATGKEV